MGRVRFNITPPPLVEAPKWLDRSGEFFRIGLFIFFHVKENEAKENARVPFNPARRRVGRSARKLTPLSAELRQSARFIPPAPSMLGTGQRETRKPKAQNPFYAPPPGGQLRPPTLREAFHYNPSF
jgi:hypothetical protein